VRRRTLAAVFDRCRAFPDECLTPNPNTGEASIYMRRGLGPELAA
jgi:hypothetical protein